MNFKRGKNNNNISYRIIGLILFVLYLIIGTLGVLGSDNVKEFSELVPGYTIIGIIFIIMISIIYGKDLANDLKKYFAHFEENFKKTLLYLFKIYVITIILTFATYFILGPSYKATGNYSVILNTFKYFPFYIVFVTVIYSPYVEEIIFRKSFSCALNNKYIFIALSGILYGLFHLSSDLNLSMFINNFSFPILLESLIAVSPEILFGCILSYVYVKERNIGFTIMIKFIYNVLATILAII
jgi:membrane protease YdiL (CAAX protease family)